MDFKSDLTMLQKQFFNKMCYLIIIFISHRSMIINAIMNWYPCYKAVFFIFSL